MADKLREPNNVCILFFIPSYDDVFEDMHKVAAGVEAEVVLEYLLEFGFEAADEVTVKKDIYSLCCCSLVDKGSNMLDSLQINYNFNKFLISFKPL